MVVNARSTRPPFLDAAAIRRGEGRRQAHVDADCEFVITPPAGRASLAVGSSVLLAGQRLDKALVPNERRLRQMYEARLIAPAPGSVRAPSGKRPMVAVSAEGPALRPAGEKVPSPVPPAKPESRPRSVPRRRSSAAQDA